MRQLTTILLTLLLLLSACESDLDMDIHHDTTAVMTSLIYADEPITLSLYGSTSYYDTADVAAISPAVIALHINGAEAETLDMAAGQTSVTFDTQASAGDSISIIATTDDHSLTASTYIPEAVNILSFDTATTTTSTDTTLEVTIRFRDPAATTDYYQLRVFSILADSTDTTEQSLSVDYSDYLFYVATSSYISTTTTSVGIFNDELINGKTYDLSVSIPKSNIFASATDTADVSLRIELLHLTYDYYCTARSLIAAQAYLLIPVFGTPTIYSNVSGGYGIVSGIGVSSVNIDIHK